LCAIERLRSVIVATQLYFDLMPPPKPPASSAEAIVQKKPDFIPSALTGWVGLVGFVLGVIWLNKAGPLYQLSRYWEGLILMAFTSVPMLVHDAVLLGYGGRGRPVDGITRQRDYSFARVGIKLLGLLGTLALLALLYWVFPEYNPSLKPDAGFYSNFFTLCWKAGPWVLGVCAVYFYFVDARLDDPHDGYWYFGRLLLWRRGIDWAKVRNHLRTWAVKGFFLPLMFTFLCNNLPGLHWHAEHAAGFKQLFHGAEANLALSQALFNYLNNFIFSIDLAFVACGYVLTLRLVQSHVRSAEPTMLGWTAALVCYLPFWKMIGDLYLGYWSDGNWESKLSQYPVLLYSCGIGILIFETIFVWATISFGLRFSNLTHRGIVTKGPYYFTKHPAYISKICAFFLTALPWIDSRGFGQGLRNLFMLAGLSFVYWLRAKTEERNLSSMDPAYSMYAEQIRQRHRRWLRFQFGRG
jgi:protein-S-isoprenylcysteine O-methyltransferase Ste14